MGRSQSIMSYGVAIGGNAWTRIVAYIMNSMNFPLRIERRLAYLAFMINIAISDEMVGGRLNSAAADASGLYVIYGRYHAASTPMSRCESSYFINAR